MPTLTHNAWLTPSAQNTYDITYTQMTSFTETFEGFGSKRALVILAKNETCQFSSKVLEFQQFAFEFNQETSPRYLFADFHYDS